MGEHNLGLPVLEARGLGYRFPEGKWAFRGVGLGLKSGEIAVLAGRNGAGKTFLARSLCGLLEASEGEVLIEGSSLSELPGNRAATVGYLCQDARLQIVGETVLDDALFGPRNLGLPEGEALERARAALGACGLLDRSEAYAHALSGGEQRRLGIAGLLALRPKVAVLDEPFANLDPESVRAVLRILREAAGSGMALLVVTHELEKVLGLASALHILDGGRLVASGSPAELLAAGIEGFGLRDPLRPISSVAELKWLD